MPSEATLYKRAKVAVDALDDVMAETDDLRKISVSAGKLITAVARLVKR